MIEGKKKQTIEANTTHENKTINKKSHIRKIKRGEVYMHTDTHTLTLTTTTVAKYHELAIITH